MKSKCDLISQREQIMHWPDFFVRPAYCMMSACRDLFHCGDYVKTIKHDPFFVILFKCRLIKIIQSLIQSPEAML